MFKRYPKGDSRTLIDFPALDISSDEAVLVCMTRSVLKICRKMLLTRGMWATTYVESYSDDGYYTPSIEGMEQVRERISEFIEGTNNIMNCQDFINALNGIASAITASSCCAAGANRQVLVGDDVYYGTEQPTDRPTTFGEGQEFPTEEAFLSHLCLVANNVVSGLISSLTNYSALTLAVILVSGVLGAAFVAAPPVAILVAISTAGLAFSVFVTMADYINTNRADWVCQLYNAESYSNALTRLDLLVEQMDDDNGWGAFDLVIKPLFRAMLDTDTWNKAYLNVSVPPVGGTDCGTCLTCDLSSAYVDKGTVISDETVLGVRTMVVETVQDVSEPTRRIMTIKYEGDCCLNIRVNQVVIGTWNGWGSVGGEGLDCVGTYVSIPAGNFTSEVQFSLMNYYSTDVDNFQLELVLMEV